MAGSSAAAVQDLDPRAPRRVRHEPRRRSLQVQRIESIAAHMLRITLGGDLDGFTSLGFDDHVKLFFPEAANPADPEAKVPSRDYTPRRYDPSTNTLQIEFVVHDAGPATRWATAAKTGDRLDIGGPRGSFIIPDTYDWQLMIADDTGLPAIARRLEEMPAGRRAVVLAEVDAPADRVALNSAADVTVTWAYRDGVPPGKSDVLARTLKTMTLPQGDYYAWVACESLIAKALRVQLLEDHGANKKWMRAAGYWRRGAIAVHDTFND